MVDTGVRQEVSNIIYWRNFKRFTWCEWRLQIWLMQMIWWSHLTQLLVCRNFIKPWKFEFKNYIKKTKCITFKRNCNECDTIDLGVNTFEIVNNIKYLGYIIDILWMTKNMLNSDNIHSKNLITIHLELLITWILKLFYSFLNPSAYLFMVWSSGFQKIYS